MKVLLSLLILLLMVNFVYGGEISTMDDGRKVAHLYPIKDSSVHVVIQPTHGKVINIGRNGLVAIIRVKDISVRFKFGIAHIKFEQDGKSWKPLYVVHSGKDNSYFDNWGKYVSNPSALKGLDPPPRISGDEEITVGYIGEESFNCYIALKDPVPDYTKPLKISFGSDSVTVTFKKEAKTVRPPIPE